MQAEAVVLLAALIKRAVEVGLTEQGLNNLRELSEREFGVAVQEWDAAKEAAPAPKRRKKS